MENPINQMHPSVMDGNEYKGDFGGPANVDPNAPAVDAKAVSKPAENKAVAAPAETK